MLRHFLSNNGVWDVWVLHDDDPAAASDPPITVTLNIATPTLPTMAVDVQNPTTPLAIAGGTGVAQLTGITLAPQGTKMFLTPRGDIAGAPAQWYALQRAWWQGATPPPKTVYGPAPHRYTVDLGTTWPLSIGGAGTGWTTTFNVPATWTGGQKELWVAAGTVGPFVLDQSVSATLDGSPVLDINHAEADVTPLLMAGSHTFAITTSGTASPFGVTGEAFVRYVPAPDYSQSLSAASWTGSTDGITYAGPTFTLPAAFAGLASARAEFTLDASAIAHASDVAMIVFTKDQSCAFQLTQVIVNGHWSCVYYNNSGPTVRINVSPRLDWTQGAMNTVEILNNNSSPVSCTSSQLGLQSTSVDFYAPGGVNP